MFAACHGRVLVRRNERISESNQQTKTYTSLPFMPLSPQNFSPETLAALQISADRAVAWTQEVQRERKFQQEHALQLKSQLFPWDQEYWAYNHDYTFCCTKARAINSEPSAS
jgi:hypothetical protein